jgi:broad specificity phosphatase PhoE
MQTVLSEQQRKDWERIKFRQEEYERKRQELHERNQNEEREELQREERLQALADRVRPHIEIDHARVLQPTQVIFIHHRHTHTQIFFRHIMLIVVY